MPTRNDAAGPGVMSSLDDMARELRALASALCDLAAIEGRLAAETVSLIMAMAVAAGVLVVSTWLFLVAACVALAVSAPYNLPAALAGAAACNGLAAILVWAWIRKLTRNLTFPELRSRLASAADA